MIRDVQANATAAGGVVRFNLGRVRVVVEYDDHGSRLFETIEPLLSATPLPNPLATLTPVQRDTVAARRAACAGCDQNGGLAAVTVKCNGCGCAGLSLLNGTCKLQKWPTPSAS
jgi:hypothetical protein